MQMPTSPSSILATLHEAGFTLPHLQGLFRHPMLSEDGTPIDPIAYGFEVAFTGGGCEAFHRSVGDFLMVLTSEDGCYLPEPHEWRDALIGVYRHGEDEDIVCVSGQAWLALVDYVDLELARLSGAEA